MRHPSAWRRQILRVARHSGQDREQGNFVQNPFPAAFPPIGRPQVAVKAGASSIEKDKEEHE
jgi:hypothetical protein